MKTRDSGRTAAFRRLLTAGASAVALSAIIGGGGTALAQEVEALPAPDETEDVSPDESATRDTIIVTGSRIARAGFDTVRPALSVGSEELDKRAFTNLADALNEIPTFGQGVDPNGTQNGFTVGANFVDLFDLGTQRTLTLVNGRRFVSSNVPTAFGSAGGLQVDFNVLPVALLDRIEVVPLAGAAVYGSDAIAGTINVILRDDYEGFEVSGQWGDAQKGDAQAWQVQSVFGANFADDRGNVAVGIEYNQQQGMRLNARPFFSENDPNLANFGSAFSGIDVDGDGDPDNEFRIYQNQVVQLFGEFGSVSPTTFNIPSRGAGSLADGNFYQFDAQGTLASCEPGISPGRSSVFFAQGGTCGIDFFDAVNQVRSPVERLNISTIAHYDVTDNIRFFAESTFSNSEASELTNQGGFQTFAFGDSSDALTFPTSNPFLTDQARAIIEGNGLTEFGVNRFNNDLVGLGENSTENFTWRVATGFEGEFELGERKFNWQASGVFGKADIETRDLGIVDGRFFNAIDAVTLNAASLQTIIDEGLATTTEEALDVFNNNSLSGVVNAGLGDIVCQANIDIAAGTVDGFNQSPNGSGIDSNAFPFADGCLPLNIFGDASILNSSATLAFINGAPRITSTDNEQRVFTAYLTGEVYQLPAGWITLNAGFENRRERAVFTPGLGTALNLTRESPFIQSGGQQQTLEGFGEIFVPVFSPEMNIPFMNFFEANASVRRVNDKFKDINGEGTGENNSTTWEFGGRWSPVEDLIFRGSVTQAIRSPSLVELFSPELTSFLFADDPCDSRFVDQGLVPATRRANCIAAGIADPDAFNSNVVNATIIGATSGNPDLVQEEAKSYNVGVVIQPRWIDRMQLSIDYFRINIGDRIADLDLTQILNACFDSPSFPNTPACSDELFLRDSSGQVIFGKTTSLNAANSLYQAFQGRFAWSIDVGEGLGALPSMLGMKRFAGHDLGELSFDATVLRARKNKLQVLDEEPEDPIGEFNDPKWQGTFDTTYRIGDFRFFWRTLWQDKPVFDAQSNSFISGIQAGNESTTATVDDVIDDEQNDRLIHNASIQYTFFDTASLQFAVDNVFARKPNTVDFAAGNFGVDEILGRRFTARVRAQF